MEEKISSDVAKIDAENRVDNLHMFEKIYFMTIVDLVILIKQENPTNIYDI